MRVIERKQLGGSCSLITHIEIEISAKAKILVVGVDVLAPTVDVLMEVVKVILATAAIRVRGCGGVANGQMPTPSIVTSDTNQHISTVSLEKIREEFCASANIVIDILAISVGSSSTFIVSELHEALLASASNRVWFTRTFLHGKRCQHNRRDSKFASILFEQVDERAAGKERALPRVDCGRK